MYNMYSYFLLSLLYTRSLYMDCATWPARPAPGRHVGAGKNCTSLPHGVALGLTGQVKPEKGREKMEKTET